MAAGLGAGRPGGRLEPAHAAFCYPWSSRPSVGLPRSLLFASCYLWRAFVRSLREHASFTGKEGSSRRLRSLILAIFASKEGPGQVRFFFWKAVSVPTPGEKARFGPEAAAGPVSNSTEEY